MVFVLRMYDSSYVLLPLAERPKDLYGEIQEKEVKDIRPRPLRLPNEFEWCDCDMKDPKTVIQASFDEDPPSQRKNNACFLRLRWTRCTLY